MYYIEKLQRTCMGARMEHKIHNLLMAKSNISSQPHMHSKPIKQQLVNAPAYVGLIELLQCIKVNLCNVYKVNLQQSTNA
jgi:hypothetical protein